MRDLAIERIAYLVQFGEPCARIRGLQKRAIFVMAGAVEQVSHGRTKVHHRASGPQHVAVFLAQYHAAARGEHYVTQRREFVHHRGFAGAKTGLVLELENHRYLHAGAILDDVIRVAECFLQAFCQDAADRGLARTHHSDQEDAARQVDPRLRSVFQGCLVHTAILAKPVVHGQAAKNRTAANDAAVPGERWVQRTVSVSLTTLGVTKINSSRLSLRRRSWRNRMPMTGMSPSIGTLVLVLDSSCSKMPPMPTVPPLSTSTSVEICLVSIDGPALVLAPTLSLLTCNFMMMLSLGVICGFTFRLRVALRNDTLVAPLLVACWYGISVPCSIVASTLSAVMTRGLEMILPLPSACRAVISRLRNFDIASFIRISENCPGSTPPRPGAGMLVESPSVKKSGVPEI